MRKYCKAYNLKDFRAFPEWHELTIDTEDELNDETICYLWDDYVVVKSPISGGVLFDTVTPTWKKYCDDVLKFEIPDYIRTLEVTSS